MYFRRGPNFENYPCVPYLVEGSMACGSDERTFPTPNHAHASACTTMEISMSILADPPRV